MKLSDLKAGDVIVLDDGFLCAPAGPVTVEVDERNGVPYFRCNFEGGSRHYLDGQEDGDGELIGVSWPAERVA